MPDERRRPGELVLAAAVARRYYLHGQSKVEIADALGVSRFKVARLIDYARESGIVRIEIVTESGIDLDRSTRLQEVFGLRHAVVVTGRAPTESTSPLESALAGASLAGASLAGASLAQLGAAAAELLGEVLAEGDVLGLPWSRSVDVMTRSLRDLPRVEVVQLTGALEVPGYDSSTVASVRRAARVSGGRSAIFYAPFLLEDASSAAALRREPQVARVLAQASRVTVAVVGIGAWQGGLSTVFDVAPSADRDAAAAAGVVGEIGGILFDAAGAIVECPLSERLVTISGPNLRAIREVVAITAGAARHAAVRAAVAGGLVDALVVDLALADALLGAPPEAPNPSVERAPRISRVGTPE
ncbi:MAG: transcriptional regulator [Intrasporangium sp.]|uniref:sugar-binding transcriptional regulator n=1 Tax=Intrasporangium sp. TaxID=1925024 RepID=UPI002648FB7D|nr:sugar-binding domain-containing protein [Intrasporangium sp.]MDN5796862.1 transcriptional regulator [Intrasporangium sp.]